LIPFVRNSKRSICINSKTSDCLSRICLNYRYTVLSYRSLNRMNLWLLFFLLIFSWQERWLKKNLPD